MARSPKFPPEHWQNLIGQRGSSYVTAGAGGNRSLFQNWLIASGVPSLFVKALPKIRLAQAYNDVTGEEIAAMQQQAAAAIEGDDAGDWRVPAPPPIASGDQAALEALRRLLAGNGPDEARIAEIARSAAAEVLAGIAPRRVEVVIGERPPVQLEHTHAAFDEVLEWLAAGQHVYIAGPAGSGKTTLAGQCAKALGRAFHGCGALESRYPLEGYRDANGNYHRTDFREAFECGGLFLFDEIDASDPASLLAFNAALANGHHPFPDATISRHADFVCIAAANTWGAGRDRVYVGRNQLDGASLDRFVAVPIDYDEALETRLASDKPWAAYVQKARKAARELQIRHVISPRATLAGCAMLSRGAKLTRDQIAAAVLWKGLDSASVAKIVAAMR